MLHPWLLMAVLLFFSGWTTETLEHYYPGTDNLKTIGILIVLLLGTFLTSLVSIIIVRNLK